MNAKVHKVHPPLEGVLPMNGTHLTPSTSPDNKQHWHTIKLDGDGFPFHRESDDITLIFKDPEHELKAAMNQG